MPNQTTGDKTVTVTANYNNSITESNYNNNTDTKVYTFQGLPDLRIASISTERKYYQTAKANVSNPNAVTRVSFVIGNYGYEPVATIPFVPCRLVDGEYRVSGSLTTYNRSLGSGQGISGYYDIGASGETTTLYAVFAALENIYNEASESNHGGYADGVIIYDWLWPTPDSNRIGWDFGYSSTSNPTKHHGIDVLELRSNTEIISSVDGIITHTG